MRGHLTLELQEPAAGAKPGFAQHEPVVVAERRAKNTVMQSGARLVAQLFSGAGGAITHMGVGTSDAEPDLTTTLALSNEAVGDAPPLTGGTTAPIPIEAFDLETDEVRRLIRVRVRATLPATAAIGRIREAGLLSRSAESGDDVLYNRVTFAPIDKSDDHELSMFWEVEFPFGDLQWLS